MAVARSSHMLLTLLLAFIGSFVWFSWDLQDSIPSWRMSSTCSCGPDSYADITIETNTTLSTAPNSTNSTVPEPIPEPTAPEDSVDESLFPLPESLSKDQLSLFPFPAKVWQKAGTHGVDDKRIPDIKSWQLVNPNLRHEILTDGAGDIYVRENYAAYPDLLNLYLSLNVPILKADLLRHLILYNEGGIWSDLDVTCEQPIDTWIPAKYRNQTNVVVGMEFDGSQFASWTVMSKPRSSHIAAVIRYIVNELEASAEDYNTTIHGLTMQTISDVVDVTGPQAMTQGIMKNLEKELRMQLGRPSISNVMEPRLIGDVLVLPNAGFAAAQGGWPKDRGPYLVSHHYAGSWKNTDGGEADKKLENGKVVAVGEPTQVKEEDKPAKPAEHVEEVPEVKPAAELNEAKQPDEEIVHARNAYEEAV